MRRVIAYVVALAVAAVVAGFYGALHNQVSYTVAPEYFHGFKFIQFAIPEGLQNRLGASWVGWQASWWMGVMVGGPVLLAGLFIANVGWFLRAFLAAMVTVVAVTFASGLAALVWSMFAYGPGTPLEALPRWATAYADPVRFARAGTMHNAAYLGGLAGIVAGIAVMVVATVRERRRGAQSSGTNR